MKSLLKKIIVHLLTLEARAVLRKYKPHIVAVTGSVGKTSTKDAIYAVLSESRHVRRSEKTFNTEVGVPLTILGLPNAWQNPIGWFKNIVEGLGVLFFSKNYPKWLVIEVGADHPGDIQWLASWLRADVVVITALPEVPTHVEFFNSVDEVVQEKAALIGALKAGGTLLLYGDDKRTQALKEKPRAQGTSVLTFGFSKENDIYATDFAFISGEDEYKWPLGMKSVVHVGGASLPVEVFGVLGKHVFVPIVAAAAVAHALGVDHESILRGAAGYMPPQSRMRLLRGIKNSLVIDDSYNSSPTAVEAALDTLKEISAKRRIAVLGDMLELGRHSIEAHTKAGKQVAAVVDLLVVVGFRARGFVEGAIAGGMKKEMIREYRNSKEAGDALDDIIEPGDVILIKGSQSMRMERAVAQVMAEPERAGELLVRQDLEWLRKV